MKELSTYIPIFFILTTLFTVFLFVKAARYSRTTMIVLLAWLTFQAIIGLSGFYTVTDTLPPRFILLVGPPILFIIGLFATTKGREYMDHLNIKTLTILHIVRIPVELVLFWLFLHKLVPELMTFEGRNFDIISGLTAPVIFYFGFVKHNLNKYVIVVWNFICLALLINIVAHAALSAPSPFQQFAFDQPNIAILYFPFNWLPGCVVPLVLLSHLVTIRQLLKR